VSRAALLLAVIGCAACDPLSRGADCLDLHSRDPGPGCTIPTLDVFIDGETSEWQQEGLARAKGCLSCSQGDSPTCTCEAGDIAYGQVARVSDDAVAFHLVTHGSPKLDRSVQYGIGMRRVLMRAADPRNYHQTLAITPNMALTHLNGVASAEGLPLEYAFSEDGLELILPNEATPYGGAMFINLVLLIPKSNKLELRNYHRYSLKLCWDASDPDNPCSLE
jgi:hypothetical protein